MLIFCLIVISSILTYFIPAGSFQREEVNGRQVIQPGTFSFTDMNPIDFGYF